MTDLLSSLQALQSENARLIALLDDHGIEWRLPPEPTLPEPAPPSRSRNHHVFPPPKK